MSSRSFYDLTSQVDEAKSYTQQFILWPRRWREYTQSHGWNSVQLDESKANQIPYSPGVYTLVLEPGIAGHPSCCYLMYVGKAVSLRRRFREYLGKEHREDGRPKIFYFLDRYDGYVCFCYTTVARAVLENVEGGLMNAYTPPLNEQYRGEISRIMRAFT